MIDAQFLLSLIDLTSLNDNDTDNDIQTLCQKALTHHVAAVCIYPRFVRQVADALNGSGIKVATVANFPSGNHPLEEVIFSIEQSIEQGAQEIDVVFPTNMPFHFIKTCKASCGKNILLKVILETGVLKEKHIITEACEIAMKAGADFLKTSTGKVPVGATLEAAEVILLAIKRSGLTVGFKASGGIRTVDDAKRYINLARELMGKTWVTPRSFRLGTSSLIDAIVGAQ